MKVIQAIVDEIITTQMCNPLQTDKDFFGNVLDKYRRDIKRDYITFDNPNYEKAIPQLIDKYTTLLQRYEKLYLQAKEPQPISAILENINSIIEEKTGFSDENKKQTIDYFLEQRKDSLIDLYNKEAVTIANNWNKIDDRRLHTNRIQNKATGQAYVTTLTMINQLHNEINEG